MNEALIVPALRFLMTSTTAITDEVPAARILTAYRDGSALPAILITPETDEAVSPSILRTDRLRRASFEISIIAATLKTAREIAEVVRVAMHGASGTYNGLRIFEVREGGINSTYDIGAEATETGIHIATVTLEAYYRSASVNPTTDPGQAP
jgi:hypothetical protein